MKPMLQSFTKAVARRSYTIKGDGPPRSIEVAIGQPIQDVETADGLDWRCPVRVTDGDAESIRSSCGIDSVQALELAIAHLADAQAIASARPGETVCFLGEVIHTRDPR